MFAMVSFITQNDCEEAKVDAERTVSLDACEEAPVEPPQPKPRKKKKGVKKTSNWLHYDYRFLLLSQMAKTVYCM